MSLSANLKPRLAREPQFLLLWIEVILDPEAVGDGTGSGVDVCLEGSDAADQVLSRGMAMMIGEILAQPAPECLDRHQIGTVAGQRDRVDAQASTHYR